jgi:hypothetical protein
MATVWLDNAEDFAIGEDDIEGWEEKPGVVAILNSKNVVVWASLMAYTRVKRIREKAGK